MILGDQLENNLFISTYASKTKNIIVEPQVIVDINLVSKILVGKKVAIMMTISMHTDITLAIPLGSSFQPNDFIIGLSQNFIK